MEFNAADTSAGEYQQATALGWYPSPEDPALLRFWDGELWTERIRSVPSTNHKPRTSPDHHIESADAVTAELNEGETIEAGFRGRHVTGVRRWWVAATNERLLIVKRKGLRRWQSQSIDYGDIRIVGVIDGCCAFVETHTEKLKFTVAGASSNAAIADVVSYVRFRKDFGALATIDLRSLPKPGHHLHSKSRSSFAPPTQTPAVDIDSLVEQIRKLDALRADGLLTDEEFDAQKSKLLNNTQ